MRRRCLSLLTLLLVSNLILITHTKTESQKQQYFQSLLKVEQQLREKVAQLKTESQKVDQESKKYQGKTALESTVLQQGVQIERMMLLEIEAGLKVPYWQKKWQCQTMRQEQKNKIDEQVKKAEDQVRKLQKLTAGINPCPRNDELALQVKYLKDRVDSIKAPLKNFCEIKSCNASKSEYWNGISCIKCPSPGSFNNDSQKCVCPIDQSYVQTEGKCIASKKPIVYIPNFSPNDTQPSFDWIYGKNYNGKSYPGYVNSLASNSTVQKCPNQKPVPNENGTCFRCQQQQGIVYDISAKVCRKCEQGTFYNSKNHSCSPNQCPDDKTYFNGKQCIKCDDPAKFNKAAMKCQCQSGYLYNDTTQKCQQDLSGKKNSNPSIVNFVGTSPTFNSNLQNCPSDRPYFNGSDCVECNLPNYWDFGNNKCHICENAMQFDIVSKKCISPTPEVTPKNSNIQSNISNYAGTPPTFNGSIQTCPIQKPYFDKTGCVPCSRPSFFDFSVPKCTSCPKRQTFNEVSKTCEKGGTVRTIYNSNFNPTEGKQPIKNYFGQPTVYNPEDYGEDTKVASCPEANPFYDQKQCLSCALPNYFNFTSSKCQSCGEKQVFNLEKRDCVKKQAPNTKKNSYLVDVQNFAGQIPPSNGAWQTCPPKTPFFQGKQCIECKTPSYFNFSTYSCEKCSLGQIFNLENKKCQGSSQRFISDVRNPNIYYNGDDFAETVTRIVNVRISDPTVEVCPKDKPFYDRSQGRCINCPDNQPLFDIKYDRCIECHPGSYFSSEKHRCVSEGLVNPTVERMIMNTFTFS